MSKAAVVVALLLIALATRHFIDTQSSSSPEGIATHLPDLYMINAAITQYGKSGHPRHDIAGKRWTDGVQNADTDDPPAVADSSAQRPQR